ncbi:spore germination protein [Clostridiales bacterium oral taxon 876 str. F0540]|nr:spore germination protein [Clostridiales bacterium oral taxon 876 str. F0540]
MKKVGTNDITANQYSFIIIGTMIGIAILSAPKDLIKESGQDAWISVIFGMMYPFYLVIMGILLFRRYPDKNILQISKICLGSIGGGLFNFVFMLQFLFFAATRSAGLDDILQTYIASFLTPAKLIPAFILAAAFTASFGLKVIGRVNEMIFYLMLILVLCPIAVLRDGSILNIMPVFQNSIEKIFVGSIQTVYSYCGVEILFIIYPRIADKENMMKASLKAVIVTALIYVWFVFSTIYYLDIDIVPKYGWPFLSVTSSINMPVINNFRYIFLFLWSIVALKTISNYFFTFTFIFNDFFKGLDFKKLCYAMYPFVAYVTILFSDEAFRRNILRRMAPNFILFNIIGITLIVIITYLKKEGKYERKTNCNSN